MNRRGALSAIAMVAAASVPMSSPALTNLVRPENPVLPKSALGNGYRGHPGSKPPWGKKAQKARRQRKLGKQSKRRNR